MQVKIGNQYKEIKVECAHQIKDRTQENHQEIIITKILAKMIDDLS